MESDGTVIRSAALIESIMQRSNSIAVSPPPEPNITQHEPSEAHRKLLLFISMLSVLGVLITVNALFSLQPLGKDTLIDGSQPYPLDRLGMFSTYYTGEYEICQDPILLKGKNGQTSSRPASCLTGTMHTTIIFHDVVNSYMKTYMLICLELPHTSRLAFWKTKRYGSNSFKNERRVYMGFSGLESTSRVETLYMSGMSAVMGPFSSKGPLKPYWPAEALKLDYWNEYSGKSCGPVCSFNTFIKQPLPNINQVSLRQIDDFYMLGARRFLLNDFEHLATLDSTKFNIFNIIYKEPRAPSFNEAETVADTAPDSSTSWDTTKTDEQLFDAIRGEIRSNDCGVTIKFTGQERDMSMGERMIYHFCIGFILKSLLETFVLCRQLRRVDEEAQGQTISIIAFSMISYQDVLEIFILMCHRTLFFNSTINFCFIVFLKCFLVGVVDHSFLVLIWRANHAPQIREGWEATQKRFALFYRYYFSFMLIQLLAWYFYYARSSWIFVFAYMCWIPQILLDAWRGKCSSLPILTVITLSMCRLFLPFYVFMLKENAFTFDVFSTDTARTNCTVGAFIMIVTLLQLILMCLQQLYGARYFASWSILPQIYNYVRPWSQMMQDDSQECVICMYTIERSSGDWCITPCDHLFHAKCLKEWTSIKLECPNCRHPLPPMT